MAVMPSPEIATELPMPSSIVTACPENDSFWLSVHAPLLRVNIQAPPLFGFPGPPMIAVLPSAESPTEKPNNCPATPSDAVSFCCWLHVPLLRIQTQAAPRGFVDVPADVGPSWGAPTIA